MYKIPPGGRGSIASSRPISLFTLSVVTATDCVDTIELGIYIANHHFSFLTLIIATATASVDTLELGVHIVKHHFSLYTLSVLLQS